jgi:arylsulfatase A-like enzyme
VRPGSSDALAYLLDLFPTACGFAGIAPPSGLDGKSLKPALDGTAAGVRDAVFTAYRDCQRAVRVGRWKLIRYPLVDRTQLFDLDADPDERHDLAAAPDHAGRVAELLARLASLQKEYGDAAPLTVPSPKPSAWTPPAGEELRKLRARWKMDPLRNP